MKFKHRRGFTEGKLDLGFVKVNINKDGTFDVPENAPVEVINRLKSVGHKPLNQNTPSKPHKPPLKEDTVTDSIDTVEYLQGLTRAEIYRLGLDKGIKFNWTGDNAHTKQDMIDTLKDKLTK